MQPSTRAQIITRRTYNRPKDEAGQVFETWEETVSRVIEHQKWLWERTLTHKTMPEMPLHDITEGMREWVNLTEEQEIELEQLKQLMMERKVSLAGRSLWLGGTWVAKNREISQFNCSFVDVRSIYDIVDVFWALLNGAGVGFRPVSGNLTGFRTYIPDVEIVRSNRVDKGREYNKETWNPITHTWMISVGDSAEAWAKSIGKLMAGKYPARKLILDFSEIRPGGTRLKNYGWISQGDKGLANAYQKIIEILNRRADSLLNDIDILDIVNLLGTVLSTRRSAQISILDYDNPNWKIFANAKKDIDELGNHHRRQSNNSLMFWERPSWEELYSFMEMINNGGNGEPGLINGRLLREKAPWAVGMNPCAEILLGDAGVCNLATIDLAKFKNDNIGLLKAAKLVTRANYRQTCVDFRDGILQEKWHLNNDHLRLCGVSVMGVAMRPDMSGHDFAMLQRTVTAAGFSIAKELGTPYPKNLTTIKPEGTISKCFDSTEGMHKPLGKYIFNNVAFSKYDPLVDKLRECGYRVFPHPYDGTAYLVTLPVKYENVDFDIVDGKEVNMDSAVTQLEKYKFLMRNYCQQNVSCTISYDVSETNDIVDWLYNNWDEYVAVSFLFRNDPTKTAADLGYPYLPQEVVTKEIYEDYISKLKDFELDDFNTTEELLEDGCAGGICPIR